jgi:hypothetical protein
MVQRLTLLVLILTLGAAGLAHAEEKTLAHDDGAPSDMVSLNTDSHFIVFDAPEWKSTFAEEVRFYGQRYGDVTGLKGTIVIWAPVTAPPIKVHIKQLGALKLLYTKQFDLTQVPEQAGWVDVPIDPVALPGDFAVSLYTYSNDQRGVKLGLGGPPASRPDSYSSTRHPSPSDAQTSIKYRYDGKDWMLRLKVRDSLAPPVAIDSSQISGPNFSVYDDGTAEGFYTFQKKGCLLRCSNAGPRNVDAVYVYGKLEGNWIGTTRDVSILILGADYKVLGRTKLPYNSFSNVAGWNLVSFAPVHVGPVFYVAVQPDSTPDLKFWVGYDSSSPNLASSYGTSGAELDWNLTIPKDKTNWMIRARYSK